MLKGKRISVIIPAYNEASGLPQVLPKIPDFVDEIIVVDDGSTDETYEVASEFAARDERLTVVRLEKNCGKGCAMRKGIEHSTGDIVVFIDADGQHKPEDIRRLIEPIIEGMADLTIGARKGDLGKRPLHRRLSNVITTRLIRWKIKQYVYDTQSGFRAFTREFLPEIESDRYEVETEMLIKASKMGARIVEVPVEVIYDPNRESRFRARDVVRFINAYLRF
ncbi:glycosyltransferase family 2 protein [Thermococcus sp.]